MPDPFAGGASARKVAKIEALDAERDAKTGVG